MPPGALTPSRLILSLSLSDSFSAFVSTFSFSLSAQKNLPHLPVRRGLSGRVALQSPPHIQAEVRTCLCHDLRLNTPRALLRMPRAWCSALHEPCPRLTLVALALVLVPRHVTTQRLASRASRSFLWEHICRPSPLPVATVTAARPMSSPAATRRSQFIPHGFLGVGGLTLCSSFHIRSPQLLSAITRAYIFNCFTPLSATDITIISKSSDIPE